MGCPSDAPGGRTPEELESLLEDAVVLRDAGAVAGLFESGGVLVVGGGGPEARGAAAVAEAARRVWDAAYLADPGRVLRVPGLALAVGPRSVTVGRRDVDGLWRYAFAVFRDAGAGEEPTVHTLVVRMSTDPARRDAVVRHLTEDIVPWATGRPGFLSGQWLLAPDGRAGGGVMVFESARAAEQAAEGPRRYTRSDARAWNIEQVEVYEQVTVAGQAAVRS